MTAYSDGQRPIHVGDPYTHVADEQSPINDGQRPIADGQRPIHVDDKQSHGQRSIADVCVCILEC